MKERHVVVTEDDSIIAYITTNLKLSEIVEMYRFTQMGAIEAFEEFSVPLNIAQRHMTPEQFANYTQQYMKQPGCFG